jgi:H+/Cl- antiporter ClcA
MTRRRATLRHWRNFLGGTLIGAAAQAPVFAADLIPSDWHVHPGDWMTRLQHGDWVAWLIVVALALIVVGVALSFVNRDRPSRSPPPQDAQNSIGRHRPQIYR